MYRILYHIVTNCIGICIVAWKNAGQEKHCTPVAQWTSISEFSLALTLHFTCQVGKRCSVMAQGVRHRT